MENIEDRCWTVKEIRPYIIIYLQRRFPDSIIEREFNQVDLMVHGPNIPVEIQKTYLNSKSGTISFSEFENDIRKQIEQNIVIFGCCWLFFDHNLLKHLQNKIDRCISINLDWLYQFYKSGKLKVFTVNIIGEIKELEDKDFEFIRRLSTTCELSKDEEYRIIERNKSKIAYNVYKGIGQTTDEINNFYDEFECDNTECKFSEWLYKGEGRKKEFARIKIALNQLLNINEALKCNQKNHRIGSYMSDLGIMEGNEHKSAKHIRCIDKYNILQYFPGYHQNKELWDYLRKYTINNPTFVAIVRGEYPNFLKDRKLQTNIEDSWMK